MKTGLKRISTMILWAALAAMAVMGLANRQESYKKARHAQTKQEQQQE